MQLRERFKEMSQRMLLDFREAGFSQHNPTKGQNREKILRDFLEDKLPAQYGVGTGEILFEDGSLSRQTDIIIYDRLKCPLLYSMESIIVPAAGTYGIIEVKSALGKEELKDSAMKIKEYKEKAPGEIGLVQTSEGYVLQPPRPRFGITFAYSLKKNSLVSLMQNWAEINTNTEDIGHWINIIVVLGEGIICLAKLEDEGKAMPLVETEAVQRWVERISKGEADKKTIEISAYPSKQEALLWFYFYLNTLLARTLVTPVDIGRYIDPNLPPIIPHLL